MTFILYKAIQKNKKRKYLYIVFVFNGYLSKTKIFKITTWLYIFGILIWKITRWIIECHTIPKTKPQISFSSYKKKRVVSQILEENGDVSSPNCGICDTAAKKEKSNSPLFFIFCLTTAKTNFFGIFPNNLCKMKTIFL